MLGLILHAPQLHVHLILNRHQLCFDLLHSCFQLILQLVDQGFTPTAIYWRLRGKPGRTQFSSFTPWYPSCVGQVTRGTQVMADTHPCGSSGLSRKPSLQGWQTLRGFREGNVQSPSSDAFLCVCALHTACTILVPR